MVFRGKSRFWNEAWSCTRRILSQKDIQLAFRLTVALGNLGVAQVRQGDYEKGISTLRRSLAITETNFGGASVNLVPALNSMAVVFQDQGDFERALPLLERSVRILEDAPPHKASELVDSINNLAELYRKAGDDTTALPLFHRSEDMAEVRFGSNHVSVVQPQRDRIDCPAARRRRGAGSI